LSLEHTICGNNFDSSLPLVARVAMHTICDNNLDSSLPSVGRVAMAVEIEQS